MPSFIWLPCEITTVTSSLTQILESRPSLLSDSALLSLQRQLKQRLAASLSPSFPTLPSLPALTTLEPSSAAAPQLVQKPSGPQPIFSLPPPSPSSIPFSLQSGFRHPVSIGPQNMPTTTVETFRNNFIQQF